MFALLCLACTGAFAAARGVVRMDAVTGAGWMTATPSQHLAPSRTLEANGLLRDGQRADTRAQATRFFPHGLPHAASRFYVAAATAAPRIEVWRTAAKPAQQNRAPYDATAPPALP
ncbi:MAG TPA: hypothetical protein VFW89_00080 [Gemmatimonadaceae bacterium]|nr:hypothetical protein [Gemmatimonadaceae bacterium]